jgi:hypothetical protein
VQQSGRRLSWEVDKAWTAATSDVRSTMCPQGSPLSRANQRAPSGNCTGFGEQPHERREAKPNCGERARLTPELSRTAARCCRRLDGRETGPFNEATKRCRLGRIVRRQRARMRATAIRRTLAHGCSGQLPHGGQRSSRCGCTRAECGRRVVRKAGWGGVLDRAKTEKGR